MSTEVWFRNPDNYIRELVECGVGNITWDRGLLVKKSIDPDKHASLYFGRAIPWRALLVGDQGTAEINADRPVSDPVAVYPTWRYGDDTALLEEIVTRPIGADPELCSDLTVPADERPVFGQEHRVVITEIPSATGGPGRNFLKFLKELQEDFPDCIFHVHGLYSFRLAFGMGFRAADFEPRTAAQKGKLHLPSGREEKYERAQAHPKWVTVLGFKPVDLAIPRNRCMYNIKSAIWAGENYNALYKFKTIGETDPDTTTPEGEYTPPTTRSHLTLSVKSKPGDKQLCDTCSLAPQCKYQRDGAVCSVPGAEPADLAKFFRTRDSGDIIDGLGILMQAQTRRLERGIEEEDDFGLNPEVTKMLGQLFDQGVKLAKLVDPSLAGGARVQVNVGAGGAAAVSAGNPRQFVAAAVAELKRQGIPAEKITPKMIEGLLSGMNNEGSAQRAVEGTVLDSREERTA